MFKNLKSLLFSQRFSDQTAKNRLQMVLVQDRSGLNSQEMDGFRKDLIDIICKYFVMEGKDIDIEWQRDGNCTALVINTPVLSKSRRPERAVVGAN